MMRIDGGDSGKIVGRTARAGVATIDGGERLLLRGRAPTPARSPRRSWARSRGEKGRVSEGFMEKGVRPERREGEGQHGQAVVVV